MRFDCIARFGSNGCGFESSLGATIGDVFQTFDETPLATASIGQVHRATLATPEGEQRVVVKVQRPNVGVTVHRDLELLHVMAAAIERAIPETRIYSPIGLVQQFEAKAAAVEAPGHAARRDRAFDLLTSHKAREAFDINKEDAKLREEYGRNEAGQRMLMARRQFDIFMGHFVAEG